MQANTLIVRVVQSGIEKAPALAATLALSALMACQPRASSKGALAAAASKSSPAAPRAGNELPPEPRIPPACKTLVADKASVKDTLAEADESKPDTDRIQSAIDNCEPGHSVQLKSDGGKDAFLTGPIKLAKGVTLWVDKGATLYASRNPRDYDVRAGTCGSDDHDDSNGCKPVILVEKAADVGIMGEGVIDGRGGEPMLGSNMTWWDVAQDAKVKNLKHSNPRLIDVKKARNFTMYKITLHNSPKFHVGLNAQGYLVWGVTLLTPSKPTNSQGKPLTAKYARNTDGIDPSAALDGVIAYSNISVGDDQIAIKAGDQGPTSNLIIAHNRFGTGHGMSIGSETNSGVSRVYVYDLAIDGDVDTGGAGDVNLNGIRIKSDPTRGGDVTDITYTDVCMRGMANPILITPHYSKEDDGNLIPNYKRIVLNNVRSMKGANAAVKPVVTLEGFDSDNALEVTLNNVIVDGINGVKAEFADVVLGPGPVNFQPPTAGDVILENKVTGNAPPNPCTGKFPEPAKH